MYILVRISTGEEITLVRSLESGLLAITVNEMEDKELGCYREGDYDILDQNGNSIL